MRFSLGQKLFMDTSVAFACNAIINGWIAKVIAEGKTPPVIVVHSIDFFIDILITTILVFSIVFSLARRTMDGFFKKNSFDAQAISPALLRLTHPIVLLNGKTSTIFLKIIAFTTTVAALAFTCFSLLGPVVIGALTYAIFKGLWCACLAALATVCGFGVAANNHL